jgi:3-phenylpropionate/cinnamic acid dioxygenase small subunit
MSDVTASDTTVGDEIAITNLLYRYAEHMDAGRFEEAAELFRHARVVLDPANGVVTDADGILRIWTDSVIRYADGTPRTKHVTTNVIVELDEHRTSATTRSYYTVFQQLEGFPLQPIISGRYHDRFEKVDGTWRFVERDYSMMDLFGDLSRHLRMAVG